VANYRVNRNTKTAAIRRKQIQTKKISQLRFFIYKRGFLKISVDLQTAFAAETQ
jgi:hypothetical protein